MFSFMVRKAVKKDCKEISALLTKLYQQHDPDIKTPVRCPEGEKESQNLTV